MYSCWGRLLLLQNVWDLSLADLSHFCSFSAAHTINFAFVPPSQRLLYINTIQIGYNVFLSFLGNREVKSDDELELDAYKKVE